MQSPCWSHECISPGLMNAPRSVARYFPDHWLELYGLPPRMDVQPETKSCWDCGAELPIGSSPRNIVQPDGLSVRCYPCSAAWRRCRALEREMGVR